MNLIHWMLKEQRQYVMEKIKAPMMKALILLANRLPEPTKQNCTHPNTHILIDIWDEFFKHETGQRTPLFKAISRVWICEHEHDPYYRDRMQVLLELLVEAMLDGKWKPRSLDHPSQCWENPNIRGAGYEFIKNRYYERLKCR